ncbi:MAG: hypothetical protein J07AB43_11470 [Candidatus Nanosalina sp. J07AB43]|nr:MAG: hypothetical protein J07AB43_11470 [Candidatus Nanosalina sp. J07AB43]
MNGDMSQNKREKHWRSSKTETTK